MPEFRDIPWVQSSGKYGSREAPINFNLMNTTGEIKYSVPDEKVSPTPDTASRVSTQLGSPNVVIKTREPTLMTGW